MKIAFVGQKGIPCSQGGVEKYVEEISARLAASGNEVVVYTRPYYTGRNLTVCRGVRLVSLPTLKTKHLDAIFHSFIATMHALFVAKANIIHYTFVGPALVSFLPRLLRPFSVRVVGTFQSEDWNHQKWGALAQACLKLGAWCLCRFSHQALAVSKEIQRYAKENYGIMLPIISNGITVKKPMAGEELSKELDAMQLEADQFFFTSQRLIRHKGVHHLIEAFKALKSNGLPAKNKNIQLVIAGDGFHTDNYVRDLKDLAAGRSDIHFAGIKNGPAYQALFEGANAFVHPTEAEGMSMVLLEALGYSKAVIVSDIEPNVEAVTTDSGEPAALVFKKSSAEDLAEKMRQVLTQDTASLASKARSHVEARYSWDKVAKEIEQIYKQITF